MSYLLRNRSEPKQLIPASSEEQQEKITEVRELLGDLPTEMPDFHSDATTRRFLLVGNWSTVQAAKSLKEAVRWRRQYEPEKIRWTKTSEKDHIKYLVYNLESLALSSEDAQEESVVWMTDFRDNEALPRAKNEWESKIFVQQQFGEPEDNG
ncbi:unnamed protein product [Urochloa humidicola]